MLNDLVILVTRIEIEARIKDTFGYQNVALEYYFEKYYAEPNKPWRINTFPA